MSAGGIIIIRSRVRDAADSDIIKDCLQGERRNRLDALLTTNVADWTEADFHFVLRAIAKAHDDSC